MDRISVVFLIRFLLFTFHFSLFTFHASLYAQVMPVEIVAHEDGSFSLLRAGEPYFIKGAGGSDYSRYAELARRGGNSVRTWGVDAQTRSLLDEAHAHGLSVMLGLWVGRETDGFNYNDTAAVANQLRRFRTLVRNFKDHPALLAWGVGNEVEVRYTNLKVWDAINDIAAMIHEEDGNHPTVAVTAHISVSLANLIAERAPNIDILGVNAYAGINSVAQRVKESQWNKPYLLAEWGVNGPWEVGKTSWGAPFEPTSTQKATMFAERYQQHILPNQRQMLGSYAFLWGGKFEGTHSWFGLYVGHETTEMIDALQYEWAGTMPDNRAPVIQQLTINGQFQQAGLVISSYSDNWVSVIASDPDGDPLYFEFLVLPESGSQGVIPSPGSTLDHIPGIVAETNGNKARLAFTDDHNKRELRLYVFVRDRKGHVGTGSFPFRTDLINMQARDIYTVAMDAYVRDGSFSTTALGQADSTQLQAKFSDVTGETRWAYLQFDLSSADAGFDTVLLELYGHAHAGTIIEVRGFNDRNWDESAITWRIRIPHNSGQIDVATVDDNSHGWWTWNVSDFVRTQFQNGNRLINLVLMGAQLQSDEPAIWNSKDSGENIPQLRMIASDPIGYNSDMARLDHRLTVYPNPVNDFLYIDMPEMIPGNYFVQIFSIQGQEVLPIHAHTNDSRINVRLLPEGLYLLRMLNNTTGHYHTASFVKMAR